MSKRVHSFDNDVLADHDAVALAKLIKNGTISEKEVLEATIKRANQVEPYIHAIVTENYEAALRNSSESKSGFFAGVPTFLKDLTCVEGLPNYFGTEAFEGATPEKKTDPIAKQIFSMGFANMGMSTMPEFGITCSTEFPNKINTVNPWNTDHSCGGSSGGAGVLVAAGVVPIAHTADGGGSTRIPASCCGLVGLKPTRGRLLLSSAFNVQAVKICVDGVVTRSVRDTAHFYHEAEKYYQNKKLPEIGLVDSPTTQSLKIGYLKEVLEEDKVDTPTKKAFSDTIQLLTDLGHKLKPVATPITDKMEADFTLLWASTAYSIHKLGKLMLKKPYDPTKLTQLTKGLSKFCGKNLMKVPGAIKRLKNSDQIYNNFLADNNIDILLTPTVSAVSPKIGHFAMDLPYETIFPRMAQWACYTPLANVTGCPSMALPIGHDENQDLPIGMMLNAAYGNDKLLLEIAFQIEAAKPWKKISATHNPLSAMS